MKNKFNIIFLIIAFFMVACEDEDAVFTGPSDLIIAGPGEVVPEESEEYTLGDVVDPESYTWSVDGNATIVGDATGSTIEVEFQSVGEVVITVTNGAEDAGSLTVTVAEVEPAVTATYNGTGVLSGGESDTVFLTFEAPLASDPQIMMNEDTSGFVPDTDAFVSGSIGELKKVDDMHYYVVYTAGSGNGTPEALLSGLESTEAFGGLKLDSLGNAYVQLYRVDNVDPVVELSYSDEHVSDSTVVTVTATFSEPVTFESKSDSAIYISFSGAGVAEVSDTLMPTNDPLVYTYDYTVNGEGNGTVNVDITNVTDLAGNEVAAINNNDALTVDNMGPIATAMIMDAGNYASIELTSTEDGTGMYLILEDGGTAPTTAEEFMQADGVASGSIALTAGMAGAAVEALATGSYDVYFMAQDEADNFSDISSVNLVMD